MYKMFRRTKAPRLFGGLRTLLVPIIIIVILNILSQRCTHSSSRSEGLGCTARCNARTWRELSTVYMNNWQWQHSRGSYGRDIQPIIVGQQGSQCLPTMSIII